MHLVRHVGVVELWPQQVARGGLVAGVGSRTSVDGWNAYEVLQERDDLVPRGIDRRQQRWQVGHRPIMVACASTGGSRWSPAERKAWGECWATTAAGKSGSGAALRVRSGLIRCGPAGRRAHSEGGAFRMRESISGRTISRRSLLKLTPAVLGVLVACTAAPPSPTPAPQLAPTLAATPAAAQAPTAAPKPTAPPAPAATAAPAAKPTVAPTAATAAAKPGLMRPIEGPPKRGGILKIAGGTVTTPHFDLHQGATAHPLTQLYNNLVRKDIPSGFRQLIPDLAESWEVSSDGKTYMFHLRNGVKWHDGS